MARGQHYALYLFWEAMEGLFPTFYLQNSSSCQSICSTYKSCGCVLSYILTRLKDRLVILYKIKSKSQKTRRNKEKEYILQKRNFLGLKVKNPIIWYFTCPIFHFREFSTLWNLNLYPLYVFVFFWGGDDFQVVSYFLPDLFTWH